MVSRAVARDPTMCLNCIWNEQDVWSPGRLDVIDLLRSLEARFSTKRWLAISGAISQ
jgi:hypothetical protein